MLEFGKNEKPWPSNLQNWARLVTLRCAYAFTVYALKKYFEIEPCLEAPGFTGDLFFLSFLPGPPAWSTALRFGLLPLFACP